MTRAVLADTGPLYAAVDPHDAHHKQAIAELRKLDREKRAVVVAYPILLEAYTMVLHRHGRSTASDWLADMLMRRWSIPRRKTTGALWPKLERWLTSALRCLTRPSRYWPRASI
jgi:predicted nucleic acid-binding protein